MSDDQPFVPSTSTMTECVVADIGGTHARFALAEIAPGERPRIGPMKRYRTREHPGLASAWAKFAQDSGGDLPRAAAIAVAAPIEGETLRFMNSDWRIPRFGIAEELGLDRAPGALLTVDCTHERGYDKILFLFDGGTLGDDEHRIVRGADVPRARPAADPPAAGPYEGRRRMSPSCTTDATSTPSRV
jgi:hypothetical protein